MKSATLLMVNRESRARIAPRACGGSSGASCNGRATRRAATTVPDWRERLRCSQCGSGNVDMVVSGARR
jgi:hypothetical protein